MPKDILADETLVNVQDRLRSAKRLVEPWHKQIRKWRAFYEMSHYNKRPKVNEIQYPDPTPTNVVDVAVGVLGSHPLEFKAVGWTPSPKEQAETDKVEKFLNGTLTLADEREDVGHQYMVNLHMVRDGTAVIKNIWDPYLANRFAFMAQLPNPDAELGEPVTVDVRGFYEVPIKTEVIDPLEMFIVPGGRHRWLYLFHVTKMTVHDVESLYNFEVKNYVGTPISEKMKIKHEMVDYWRVAHYPEGDVIINAVMYNEEWVLNYEPKVMEGYEEVPFSIGFFKPVDRKSPKNWGHGVISPLEPSVRLIERNVNRRQRQIDVFTALPMMVKSLPGRSITVDAGFGKALQMSVDEEISFPQWQGNPPDSNLQIDYLRSRLQQSGFSDILYGMEGHGAGYAISQMTDQNRIRLIEPIKQIERLWGRWAKKSLKLVRNFGANSLIRVYGTFKGIPFADQIIGGDIADYMVTAKIKAEFPNQQVTNAALSTQSADVLSKRTRQERYWDIDQPTDEWKQQMMEMAEQHPAMINYGILGVLMEKAAMGDQAAAMAVQLMMAEQQGQQQGGGEGGEEAGSKTANQLGTASATGERTPQEEGRSNPGQSTLESVERLANASPGLDGSIGV